MSEETQYTNENQTIEAPKSCHSKKGHHHKMGAIFCGLNILMLIGLVVLYILFFRSNNVCSNKTTITATEQKAAVKKPDNITFAYINTDTIIAQYQYAKDLEKELLDYKNSMEKNYTNKVNSLQKDVAEYLKVGATLTLSEQKKREESFKQREAEIGQMQQRMMMDIQQKQITENTKLLNAIFAFIKDYNLKHNNYTFIMKKSFTESPLLYAHEGFDITKEIIDGLNAEYKEVKGK